jgi:hypothetical protein
MIWFSHVDGKEKHSDQKYFRYSPRKENEEGEDLGKF